MPSTSDEIVSRMAVALRYARAVLRAEFRENASCLVVGGQNATRGKTLDQIMEMVEPGERVYVRRLYNAAKRADEALQ